MRKLYFVFVFVLVLLSEGETKRKGGIRKFKPRLEKIPEIEGRLLTPKDGCGYTRVKHTRIVGGAEAPIGAWPWMALLGYVNNGTTAFHCGGSLITSRHILTAAHCSKPPGLKFVRLGEHTTATLSGEYYDDIPIKKIRIHEQYRADKRPNDIAIIYLAHDVEFSDRIRPVCLPMDEPMRSHKFIGTTPFVIGFGATSQGGKTSEVLMQLQVPIVNNRVCRNFHLKFGVNKKLVEETIDDHVICAGIQAGKGVWRGDSGGPLILPMYDNGKFPFYQIGIVSCSFVCAAKDVPAVYTKIQYFAEWIKQCVNE